MDSLANDMVLQKNISRYYMSKSFHKSLRIRLHYSQPIVFDKLFFITRGGTSTSSKGINLSKDIVAGYNNVIGSG